MKIAEPKPIYSPGLRGAVKEVLQSESHQHLRQLMLAAATPATRGEKE